MKPQECPGKKNPGGYSLTTRQLQNQGQACVFDSCFHRGTDRDSPSPEEACQRTITSTYCSVYFCHVLKSLLGLSQRMKLVTPAAKQVATVLEFTTYGPDQACLLHGSRPKHMQQITILPGSDVRAVQNRLGFLNHCESHGQAYRP